MQFTAVLTVLATFGAIASASSTDMCRSAPIRVAACEDKYKRSMSMTTFPRQLLEAVRGAKVAEAEPESK